MVVDQPLLVNGEATSNELTTAALPVTFRAQGHPRFGQKSTGACSPTVMADGGGRVVVRRWSSATICSGDELYSYVVLKQS